MLPRTSASAPPLFATSAAAARVPPAFSALTYASAPFCPELFTCASEPLKTLPANDQGPVPSLFTCESDPPKTLPATDHGPATPSPLTCDRAPPNALGRLALHEPSSPPVRHDSSETGAFHEASVVSFELKRAPPGYSAFSPEGSESAGTSSVASAPSAFSSSFAVSASEPAALPRSSEVRASTPSTAVSSFAPSTAVASSAGASSPGGGSIPSFASSSAAPSGPSSSAFGDSDGAVAVEDVRWSGSDTAAR
mmetsp:Transcript_32159/g.74911  ORF Transcript_32159/g.74911 Transcript_32159/m.74911 type:complete len:252 (-) Transcript_32159:460-1215(-)